jgi:serine/threonine protein kinase
VWKVKNRETGKVYAAKEIVKNSLKSPEEMNLREEIRIQRIVGLHDNIVTMIEFVETWDR